MRKSEIDVLEGLLATLDQTVDGIRSLIKGEVPAAKPVKPRLPGRRAAAAVTEGEVHAGYDENEGGFFCNLCEAGPMKVGETAEHLWAEHGIPLANFNIEGLTHGRKWQMKKHLEKVAPDALEGYGRKAKKPAARAGAAKPKPTKEKRWRAEKPEETGISGDLGIWHPDGDSGHSVAVEFVGEWKKGSPNILVKEIDKTPGAGKIRNVPKEHVYIRGEFPGSYSGVEPHRLARPSPQSDGKSEPPEEKRPSWRRTV